MTTTISLSFAALNIDCADAAVLADFWGKALGCPVSLGAIPGDMAVDASDPAGGPRMLFHPVPEPATVKAGFCPVLLTDNHDGEAAGCAAWARARSARSRSRRCARRRSPTRRVTSSTW